MSMRLSMFVAVLGLLLAAGTLEAAPYQELAPRAGHVPVYIREGDTPLSVIHPQLAEAFHEIDDSDLITPSEEKKSALTLMPADDANASNLNAEEVAVPPQSDSSDDSKKTEDKPSSETSSVVVEAAKEAIRELVSIFETDMFEKLGLADTEKPKAEEKENVAAAKPKKKNKEEKAENSKTTEKPTDVLTVEAFKAKDFDKKPVESEEMDVPEEIPAEH